MELPPTVVAPAASVGDELGAPTEVESDGCVEEEVDGGLVSPPLSSRPWRFPPVGGKVDVGLPPLEDDDDSEELVGDIVDVVFVELGEVVDLGVLLESVEAACEVPGAIGVP